MAERYQVRGRRIWDSETDTYSCSIKRAENAEWCAKNSDLSHWTFKPLAEWQDDTPAGDAVDHPSHYTHGPVECIDAIASALGHDAFIAFLRGQIIKYMWRLGRKGNALEDAQKGTWYANRLVEELAK